MVGGSQADLEGLSDVDETSAQEDLGSRGLLQFHPAHSKHTLRSEFRYGAVRLTVWEGR